MSSSNPNWGRDCKDCKHYGNKYDEEPCWDCINSGILRRVHFEEANKNA